MGKVRPGGTLLFDLGGTGGRRAAPGLSFIAARGAGLPVMTKNLALELAPIRVNLIAAGFVDTRLSAAILGDQLDARREQPSRTDAAHPTRRRTGRRRRARRTHHDQHSPHRRDLRHRRRPAARVKNAAYLAFVLLGVIWGSNFIFMKWAAEDISPSQIVLLRVVFGFLPIFFVALAKRALRWKHLRYVHHFVVMSLLATAVYYLAFAKGTALLPSSIAGLLSGAIPLFTFICAWLFLSEEHINITKAAGVALGFVGVLLIARPWSSLGAIDVPGVVYMMIGSMSVGCSFVYARRFISPLSSPQWL